MRDWSARAVTERARASPWEIAVASPWMELGKRLRVRFRGSVSLLLDWQREEPVPSKTHSPKKPTRMSTSCWMSLLGERVLEGDERFVVGTRDTAKISVMPGAVEAQPDRERAAQDC